MSQSYVLASPDYIALRGNPESVTALVGHTLLGVSEPDCLNVWPIRHSDSETLAIRPALTASNGETIRQLTLQGMGVACLPGYVAAEDMASGRLVKVLPDMQNDSSQPVHAVYYRNGELSLRTKCFLDFLQQAVRELLAPLG
jgi:DNA-binding transcriptional LysR family regulator